MTTLKELLAQQTELAKKIEEVRKVEVAGAIEQVKAIIEEYELTVDDIFPQRQSQSTKKDAAPKIKGVAKYRSSIDPNKTWSGRGRKPEWVLTFLGNGGTLEELEIKSN